MRFLVDAQLPPALAHWLGEKGFAATPVRELGLREADDGSIWNFATSGGWTVLTKDEDFVARGLAMPDAPAIVCSASATAPTACSLRGSKPLLPGIVARLDAGDRLVEVRRERPKP